MIEKTNSEQQEQVTARQDIATDTDNTTNSDKASSSDSANGSATPSSAQESEVGGDLKEGSSTAPPVSRKKHKKKKKKSQGSNDGGLDLAGWIIIGIMVTACICWFVLIDSPQENQQPDNTSNTAGNTYPQSNDVAPMSSSPKGHPHASNPNSQTNPNSKPQPKPQPNIVPNEQEQVRWVGPEAGQDASQWTFIHGDIILAALCALDSQPETKLSAAQVAEFSEIVEGIRKYSEAQSQAGEYLTRYAENMLSAEQLKYLNDNIPKFCNSKPDVPALLAKLKGQTGTNKSTGSTPQKRDSLQPTYSNLLYPAAIAQNMSCLLPEGWPMVLALTHKEQGKNVLFSARTLKAFEEIQASYLGKLSPEEGQSQLLSGISVTSGSSKSTSNKTARLSPNPIPANCLVAGLGWMMAQNKYTLSEQVRHELYYLVEAYTTPLEQMATAYPKLMALLTPAQTQAFLNYMNEFHKNTASLRQHQLNLKQMEIRFSKR